MTASRSIGTLSRSRVVALAALTTGVAAVLSVSACSAGQITQTDTQVSSVQGANADGGPDAADPTIHLRDLMVVYKDVQGYPQGGSAPLVVRIFNSGDVPLRLVSVTPVDAAAEGVRLVGGKPAATPLPTSNPSTSAPSTSASASASAGPSGSASASSPAAEPTKAPPAGESTFSIEVPAASYVLLVPGAGPYLQVTGLATPLVPGNQLKLRFAFSDGTSIEVSLPVGPPPTAGPRASAAVVEEHE